MERASRHQREAAQKNPAHCSARTARLLPVLILGTRRTQASPGVGLHSPGSFNKIISPVYTLYFQGCSYRPTILKFTHLGKTPRAGSCDKVTLAERMALIVMQPRPAL